MSRRNIAFLSLGVLAGLLASAAVRNAVGVDREKVPNPQEPASSTPSGPVYGVEFGKAYDLHCSSPGRQEPTVHRCCTILGFTARGLGLPEATGGGGSGFLSSGDYRQQRYFEQWLALRLADGRQAYIPASSVEHIEEARCERP